MKVDAGVGWDLAQVASQAKQLEAMGYSGLRTAETAHDPFFPLVVAAEHTTEVDLITSIAVAFARTPMVLAQIGHDLNAASKGRFVLGLGSQIRPHIMKRFSMPWSRSLCSMPRQPTVIAARRSSFGRASCVNYSSSNFTFRVGRISGRRSKSV